MTSSIDIDKIQPTSVVAVSDIVDIDIDSQVNLNHLTGSTLNPVEPTINIAIDQPISQTASEKRTTVLDRTTVRTEAPIFRTYKNKPDNISIISDVEIANANQDDDENYLSTAEIDETSLISDMANLHLSKIDQNASLSPSHHLTIFNVVPFVQDEYHMQATDMTEDQRVLLEEHPDSDIDPLTSISHHSTTDDIHDDPSNIVLNKVFRGDENTDRVDHLHAISENVIVTAVSSATSHGNPKMLLDTSDNLKIASKLTDPPKVKRKVQFVENDNVPTVLVMNSAPQVKRSSVPLIHSVLLCPIDSPPSNPININSIQHSPNLMNPDEWRQAFPEPDLSSFDNSIYVSVAVQAMSIEDCDSAFPSMSTKVYGNLQSTFQIDGGASLTAISEVKARELHCHFIERKKYQVVVSVANGQQMRSDYYTPLKVTFKGVNTQHIAQFKTVMIIANVVPTLSGGIIIGSDVMKALQVTIPYNDDKTAMLTVNGDTIKFQYSNTSRDSSPSPFVRSIKVVKSERTPITMKYSFNALFFGDRENSIPLRPIPSKLVHHVRHEHTTAMEDPEKYMNEFNYKQQVSIPQLVAIHCILSAYDIEGEQQLSCMSRDGIVRTIPIPLAVSTTETLHKISVDSIFDKHISQYASAVTCLINQTATNNQSDHIHNYIHHTIDSLYTTQYINKLAVVDDDVLPTSSSIKEQDELLVTTTYITKMHGRYCNNLMLDQRPEEFPLDLWSYVFDSQKVLIKERWDKFKAKCNPPERLHDVIAQIMKIDISKENPSRIKEEPYFRAQCLANLHIYAHPDPTSPPSVKGREYEINLTDTSPCTNPLRRTSLLEKAYLYWRTKQLMGRQMIGVSSSAYNNPPLCVPYPAAITAFIKKHGENASEAIWKEENQHEVVRLYRLVNDFRDLNNKTKLERWPLPYILDLIDKMRGSGRYSTEDIEDAFFTVPMKKEHRQFTAFSTPHGHFEYLCMGQGLKNAANFFARIVHEMFSSLQIKGKSMSVYQDDVCNFDDDLLQHLDLQQEIYDIMEDNTLVFKSIKGHLNYTTQRILGHIMSKEGRAPDPTLVSTINNLAKPTTLEGVRSCLGLAQVAREYIHDLADIIAPIQQLARKGVDIDKDWGPEQDAAFSKLKTVITTAPVLALPNLMKKFRVHVDACRVGRGIGAILLQLDETIAANDNKDVWQPTAYWSRALSKEERRYSATELECTGLHDSLLHWRVYLQNGIPFDVIVDHYALVYMVTKMSDIVGKVRLHSLCLGLQGFTFSVIHRKGSLHLDADAVSRLFHKDEQAYIHTEDDLRDDMNPLTEREKSMLDAKWGNQDSLQIQEIIARHRMEQRESISTDVMKGSETKINMKFINSDHDVPDLLSTSNIENTIYDDQQQEIYDEMNVYSLQVNSIRSKFSSQHLKKDGVLPEYTFCFYCDAGGVVTNHYLEGGSQSQEHIHDCPYLLKIDGECLICLSIYTWINGVPTYTSVVEQSGLPFTSPLSNDDLKENLHESNKWVQKTINVSTLDKVHDVLQLHPIVSYSTYRTISDLLKINWLSNFCIRLLISTRYKILPKIIIDTLEYDFVMRRMGGRGYTKYFKDLTLSDLMQLTTSDDNIMKIIPNFSKLGDEKDYVKTILTIMIKEEITHRQDVEFIRHGEIPIKFYGSISKLTIEHYLNDNSIAHEEINLVSSLQQSNLSNEYMGNLNDIRTSVRLQKKKELRQERKLEELRQQQLLVSKRKSIRRTKIYNQKARKKLIRNGMTTAVLQSEDLEKNLQKLVTEFKDQVSTIVSADDSIAISIEPNKATVSLDEDRLQLHIPLQPNNTTTEYNNHPLPTQPITNRRKKKKRPKMIIVDKTQRRPPSRLIGEEHSRNRDHELIHESLEGYDYLVQEYFIDPDSDSMYMVINTYLDTDNQYRATICPIDCELQDKDLASPEFKSINICGEDGVIHLVSKFHNMVTANGTWPTSNEMWMEAQSKDEVWSTILLKLNQHNTCIILKREEDHIDYVTRELLDDGSLGPLIRYISVPKQLSHSHLILSYKEEFRQMIVPDHLIMSCVEITHRALGHPGFHRMWNTIRRSYYWKSMQNDVRTYCSTCHYCRARKSSSERGSIPIQGYYISERPWQRCHIDCMVGLPISDEGQYTAVLILKCALSKFVCLEPLKDVSAQSICEALLNIFTNHGVPEFIISDNGVEFANYLTKDVLKLLGARNFHITPINPRANGQAENQVKTVKDTLSMLIKKDQRDWSMFIRLVQMRYNSTVNQATGFSPYFLMNGREMPSPDHDHIQSTYDKNKSVEIEGYFGNLVVAMMLIWEAAGEEILQKTANYNKIIGTNIEEKIRHYEIGQYVFVRRLPRRFYKDQQENVKYHINMKLQPVRWTGPYRILQKISPVLYVLDFHNQPKKIHITHLKIASNLSVHRRRLEIIRQRDRNEGKTVTVINNNNTVIDDIWHKQQIEDNLD